MLVPRFHSKWQQKIQINRSDEPEGVKLDEDGLLQAVGENGLECRMSVMKMEIFRTAWGYALFAVVMTIRVSSD